MDFIDTLRSLALTAQERAQHIKTEEATKTALVLPFLQALGYNVFDPSEVVPEFVADVGVKKGEKVDYAIMRSGQPAMLIECKALGASLEHTTITQLFRYFTATPTRFGILTDGMRYRFFSDLSEKNRMDTSPFMEFDLAEVTDESVANLKQFTREGFDEKQVVRNASNLKYMTAIKQFFAEQLETPHEGLVYVVIDEVHGGHKFKKRVEKFSDLTRRAFREFINDQLNDRLRAALDSGKEDEPDPEPEPVPDVVTTDEELRAAALVREMCKDLVDPARIVIQDYKLYCNLVLDGNKWMNVVRMHLDGDRKRIEIAKELRISAGVTRHEIDSVESMVRLAEPIRNRIQLLLDHG